LISAKPFEKQLKKIKESKPLHFAENREVNSENDLLISAFFVSFKKGLCGAYKKNLQPHFPVWPPLRTTVKQRCQHSVRTPKASPVGVCLRTGLETGCSRASFWSPLPERSPGSWSGFPYFAMCAAFYRIAFLNP
jgi:hypothetical protein